MYVKIQEKFIKKRIGYHQKLSRNLLRSKSLRYKYSNKKCFVTKLKNTQKRVTERFVSKYKILLCHDVGLIPFSFYHKPNETEFIIVN